MDQQQQPYNAVMVDLETMSTEPDAAIISIGAVKFWMNVEQDEFTLDQLFHVKVDLVSCQHAGLRIDAGTVKWWLSQDKEAQVALLDAAAPLGTALLEFSRFVPQGALIFGNGATFDNVILRNAYKASSMTYPVSYRQDVCYRTLSRMSDVILPKFEGTKHNALDDAKMQTKHLMAILRKTPWHKL